MLGIIVQARMGSTRLPGKVLKPLGGVPAILRVLDRCRKITDRVSVATTISTQDNILIDTVFNHCQEIYQGSELDVLDRYHRFSYIAQYDPIVRITGDCPLLDPDVAKRVIDIYNTGRYDYVSNVHPPSWPDGLDIEVFSQDVLSKAWAHAKGVEREHVTPYIWRRPHKFRLGNLMNPRDLSTHRWTLDTQEDYDFLDRVYKFFGDTEFSTEDVLNLPFQHTLPRIIRL